MPDATRRSKTGRRAGRGATPRRRTVVRAPRQPSVWLNRLLVLCAAAVVIAGAAQAWLALERRPVERIAVSGELARTQEKAVQDMVHAALAGGFVGADLQLMRRELESLPWIFEATVRRRWPSTLEIHIVEQVPIARWGKDGFLNHEGGIFYSSERGDLAALPLLQGPAGSAPALMAKYQRLLELLTPLDLAVEQLLMDERGQIEAVLGGGLRLVLGNRDFRERMARFAALYLRELAARRDSVQRVDLRYAAGAAVAFEEASQVAGLEPGRDAQTEPQGGT